MCLDKSEMLIPFQKAEWEIERVIPVAIVSALDGGS